MRIQSQLADGSAGDARVQFGGNRLAPDDSRERGLQLINQSTIQPDVNRRPLEIN